jgi:DNA-directed RNA polymerase II subunit RPB2
MESAEPAMSSLQAEGLQFLEKYFRENDFALTRHHIDGYEQCVFEDIPSIIHSTNPLTFMKETLNAEEGVFAYKIEVFIGGDAPTPAGLALSISPPVVSLDDGHTVRRMLPNEARLRNLTYAAQISADILVRVTFTRQREGAPPGTYDVEVKEAPIVRGFPLFRLPILLRSRLCPTSVADPARLEELGECRNDYGGYFIIGGAEKILITRGEQAFNSLYVDKKPETDTQLAAYASVVSLHPETKQTRRVAIYVMRTGAIRVAVPMIRGAFPLFVLFRALGVESDEEIVRMIFPAPHPLEEQLAPCVEDAYPFLNRYTAIRYIMTLTKGFTEAHVLDILQNLMLPHVVDEPMARAQYLATMTREALMVGAGLKSKTDRDDMRNQRFLPTGVLVRELFNACWKEWRATVVGTVDRAYRQNSQIYQGDAVFDLFAPSNLQNVFKTQELNQLIMRGFRGKWGTNEYNTKVGVLQPLARISYHDAMSHTRRVVSDFDTSMKTTGPRKLHTSHVGYFCTSETPQGAHIGVTKNMSIMTQYSMGAAAKPVYDWLRLKGGVIPVVETTAALRATAAIVEINGGTIGFTTQPHELVRILKLLKWTACLAPTASVSFNTLDKTVRILLDEGRPIRPLWHLNGEGVAFLERLPALKAMPWRDLVFGTLPATAGATMRTVRFLDPLGDAPAATFADYEALLAPTAGFIEYCDPTEMNENYVSWWGSEEDLTTDHTHCEIHPSTMMGLMASMIPYSNHNQAPRNQLSNSQSKQGIGYIATNIQNRFDTYANMLCYGEAPLCRTFYYETIGNGEMPYGFNCIIAATSESGYNQDDGLIINRDSVARGMFQNLSFRSYDCAEELDTRTKVHSHVANPATVPAWSSLRPGLDYSKLDERGIIREGEYVTDKTVLVGRYMVVPDTNDIKDDSVTPGLHTHGRVDTVVVLHQADGRLLVKVRIIQMRVPVLGDKFSSRHGQKGTIGMLVAAADMPRTAEGIVPDVMVNPGGLISRMTVAQLIEMIAGRAAADLAAKFNATTFCNGGEFVTQLGNVLKAIGAQPGGDNILYSGITGEQIRTEVFMCPLFFMRLKHLTDDKVNSRGAGRREVRTHQPTGGRANEGGLRIGEMERDSLCAHGVSSFLQESMMKRGDATDFWICNGCGRIPIYNLEEGLFVCPTCDGPLNFTGVTADTLTLQLPTKQSRVTFSKVAMPYTMKLVDQEMSSIGNMGFRLITEGVVSRMREDDWAWPSFDVEFKAGERGVEESGALNPEALAAQEAAIAAATEAKKPQRKKAAAAVAGAPVEGEGAADAVEGVLAAAEAATAVRFHAKLDNDYQVFSNLAIAPFRVPGDQIPTPDGVAFPAFGGGDPSRETWPSVEHYYQAMKFPQDPEWQEEIRLAPTALRAKKMGLDREHPLRGDWETVKERVMKRALLAKFRQNLSLLDILQKTGDRPLEDASPGDAYWGMGARGKGKNRMGALLEEVRAELKDVRIDTEALEAQPPAMIQEDLENANVADEPENFTAAAEGIVAAATNGLVQLQAGGPAAVTVQKEGAEGEGEVAAGTVADEGEGAAAAAAPAENKATQSGGVYLFINPNMGGGGASERRAQHARRSSRHRGRLSWAGLGVDDSGDGDATQSGGGDEAAGPMEVHVQKME